MQITDFYSKFVSATEKSHLFQALRNLSRAESLKDALDINGEMNMGEWTPWPPMEAAAVCPSPTAA